MSDLIDDDVEFRGGTLQLSTDNVQSENVENQSNNPQAQNTSGKKSQANINPSVLSGTDSLTSSTSSFADARVEPSNTAETPTESVKTVYPRYDVPFNKENIKDFFTFRKGVTENAIQECITALLFPEDGEYLGSWLLTEITLWDNEKERIVLLTSRLVMTIKYDFIAMKQLDFKKTYLDDLDTIVIGELVYPPSSLVPERNLRGVCLMWNKGEPLPLKTAWNPFSHDIPFLTFASHPIYWHKEGGIEERAIYDMETFALKLQRAIEGMPSSGCCIHHSPIIIQSYVGLTSLLHNKTSMGFFKISSSTLTMHSACEGENRMDDYLIPPPPRPLNGCPQFTTFGHPKNDTRGQHMATIVEREASASRETLDSESETHNSTHLRLNFGSRDRATPSRCDDRDGAHMYMNISAAH